MIPITISKLAKRHKQLTDEFAEKLAIPNCDIEIMQAVDLVLDGIVKLKDREKKKQSHATTQRGEMDCCPVCGSLKYETFNEYTTPEGERRRARCNLCQTEWVQVVMHGHVVERTNILMPC